MRLTSEHDLYLLIFEISHALFLAYSFMGHIDALSSPLKIGTMFAMILFIVNSLMQHRIVRFDAFLGYAALVVLSLLHANYSQDYGFFKLMVFAGSIQKVNFKKMVRFDMYLRFVLIVVVVWLCSIDIAPDVISEYDGVSRRSLGFTNPNTLGTAIFVLICDILYVNDMKITPKTILLVTGISAWLYSVARCRTAAYVISYLVTVILFYHLGGKRFFNSKMGKLLIYSLPLLFSFLTMYVTSRYAQGDGIFIKLNRLLSGRLEVILQFSSKLDPTLLGQPISQVMDKSLDNAYAFILFDLGLLVSVLFIIAYMRMIYLNIKRNQKLCLIMIGFMIYGLSEHLWINVDYNVFMLAFLANTDIELNEKKEKNSAVVA